MSRTGEAVLIASSSFDEEAWRPVARGLSDRNFNVLVYEADKVADGRAELDIQVRGAGLQVRYGGKDFNLGSVAAAWYRRPNTFSLEQDSDKARQMCLDIERRRFNTLFGILCLNKSGSTLLDASRMRNTS